MFGKNFEITDINVSVGSHMKICSSISIYLHEKEIIIRKSTKTEIS